MSSNIIKGAQEERNQRLDDSSKNFNQSSFPTPLSTLHVTLLHWFIHLKNRNVLVHGALLRDDVCNLKMFKQSVTHSTRNGENVSDMVPDLQVNNVAGVHKSTHFYH